MNKLAKGSMLMLTALLVFVLSMMQAAPVFADGGTPSGTTPATTSPSTTDLSQLPSGTSVVVVDNSGHKVPLGTQKAANIVETGDPVWCPATVAVPTPGSAGCSPATYNTDLYTLITNINSGNFIPTAANSTIWITQGPDGSTNPVSISGANMPTNFTLTLKGGWSGSSNTTNSATPSLFSVPISINWNGAVTLSNITISGVAGDGLDVSTKGNIALTYVKSDANTGNGAYLDNTGGTGTITVANSEFNNSTGGFGLQAYSRGAITLSNVTADGNLYDGAWLDNCAYGDFANNTIGCTILTSQPVTISGTNSFSNNGSNGLDVYTTGNITTNNLTAGSNGGEGAYLDNCQSYDSGGSWWVCSTSTSHAITMNGNNTFNNNGYDGLYLESNGAVKTNNLTANSNGSNGAYMDNDWALTPQAFSMTGTNAFNGNYYDGLDVYSYGLITANNITANDNGVSGSSTDQYTGGVGAYLASWGTAGVTLTGTNTFNGNYSTLTFDDGNPADYWTWTGGGLSVLSYGAVKLNHITANNDLAGAGATIDNCLYYSDSYGDGCQASTTVTFTGINTFNNNALDGLDVNSFGNIAASDLNADGNGQTGVYLHNDNASYSTGLDSKGTITLTGTNIFTNNNLGDGLEAYSYGAIKASNVNALYNGSDGAYLYNKDAATAQPVTLTNSNVFSYNGSNGLEVYTNGVITLSSLTANSNTGNDGALLSNSDNGFTSNVTLTGNDVFNDNNGSGLELTSNGVILVNTVTLVANGNQGLSGSGFGVSLDNSTAGLPKSVTLKGTSLFDGNYAQGLAVNSKGAITAGNITVLNGVAYSGATFINDVNDVPGAVGGVTLTGTNVFSDNARMGLMIISSGAVTLNNVIANGNDTANLADKYGVSVDNSSAMAAQTVTFAGYVIANDNWFGGISVLSKGAIKANNVMAMDNLNSNGASFNNSTGASTATVTLTGANFFDGNLVDGLLINSAGAVSLTKITANDNGADGLNVTTPLTLMLVCGSFNGNTGYGINVNTGGAVTVTGAVITGNTAGNTVNQTGSGGTPIIIRTCTLP